MNKNYDYNPKDMEAFLILCIIMLDQKRKWEKLRKLYETEDIELKHELANDLEESFLNNITPLILPSDTNLYRARSICSYNYSDLGVNPNVAFKEMYEILLSNTEKQELEKVDFSNLEPEDFYTLKQLTMKEFTAEQLKYFANTRKKYSNQRTYGFNKEGSGIPPQDKRKEGRLNTVYDAYLYLAFEKETAIQEMRPYIGQQYSLATFRTTAEIKIVDLSDENSNLITLPIDKISEPNTDDNEKFYRITQELSHIIQKRGFDGIKYRSALRKEGNNIVLFNENNIKFISSDIIRINDVNIVFSNVLPFLD